MAGFPAAEPEALRRSFSYLVNSMDTDVLLPAALSRDLISDRQRNTCLNETDPYKKAETFLGYIIRAVNADYDNYHAFVQILKQTGQGKIASHLREELTHTIRSISVQQLPVSSTTNEGERRVVVPDTLVEELANLRFAFAKLTRNYEKQLRNSPEAQEEFVAYLPRLFHKAFEEQSFPTQFNTVVQELSLFNIFYLKRLCSVFPEDVRAATRQLVDEYEEQRQRFMTSTTVSQFKELFPANATPLTQSEEKVKIKLKIENYWDDSTLEDLTKFVSFFGVSGSHVHLSRIDNGCIAVTWLCSTIEVKQLKMAISDNADLFRKMGVLQCFIGEELVLECSNKAAAVKQLKRLSEMKQSESTAPYSTTTVTAAKVELERLSDDDLPESSGIQAEKLMTASPPKESQQLVTAVHLVPQITDIEYQCPVCLEVFTDLLPPYLTDCGHHLCGKCCNSLLNIGTTDCPNCRKPGMVSNARCDKYFQRMVKSLKVRCSNYKEGCEWVGELKDLHDHLDPAKGQCGIACLFGCGKYYRRSEIKEHTRHCHMRKISCENCGYYNTFSVVTEKHYPICPQSPINLVLEEANQAVAIPPASVTPEYLYNQAPMEYIVGDYLEKKEANVTWSSSPFYTDKRGYKFRIHVVPNGDGVAKGSHISVYAQIMAGEYDNELEWPFEGDIKFELLNWRADENHRSYTVPYEHSRITSGSGPSVGRYQFVPHDEMVHEDKEYLRADYVRVRVSVQLYSTPPPSTTPKWQDSPTSTQSGVHHFTISEYSKRKLFNNIFFSPPFTTSPQGYKLCLKVYTNGEGNDKNNHLSIYAYIMKGQHDDHLQWPFTGSIIIELFNWKKGNEHYKKTIAVLSGDQFLKVTEGTLGKSCGPYQLISQSSLEQYLEKDCIYVRVQAIYHAF